jgi:hypothetical protein
MYMNPTQFPEQTNRESFSPLIGIYDDDTGDPISLTNSSGAGTFSSWIVQVSTILYGSSILTTTSLSTLTIATGSQSATLPVILLAPNNFLVQITIVSPGLPIVPGQYVMFTASSDSTKWMAGIVTSYNPVTGSLNFTVATVNIQLEIRRMRDGPHWDGYSDNFAGYGSTDCDAPILTASVGNGIYIVDTGIIQVYFSKTSMRRLSSGVHSVAATLDTSDEFDARQLFRGRLPIFEGGVT